MSGGTRPLYFPSGDRTLFGWLHPARGTPISDAGIVICAPFGYEAICAHRSLRAFADVCAAAGVSALRFDYSGTGDSSNCAPDADQISIWRDDLRSAIQTLRSTCKVRRVCLMGVRLGALVAGLVAAEEEVDALVAITPVTSGRRYLRELRAFQAGVASPVPAVATPSATPSGNAAVSVSPAGSANPAATPDQTASGNPANAPNPDDGLDITGFRLSRRSVEQLERVDLAKLSKGSCVSALILDRDDLPAAKPWAAALESGGVRVSYQALPGFNEMMANPHAALVPAAKLAALQQWLAEYRVGSGLVEPPATHLPAGARMRLRDESGVDLIERAMFVDGERTVFAIMTERADRAVGADTSGYGVVMLNTGATSRIGPNRMYVDLSRQWAARGYVVLRMDLAGLGDSATRPGEPPNVVYPPNALYDVSVAIEFLRRRRGVRDITLAGLCAGAYHSLRAAISGVPVSTILLVNPLTFYWKQGATLSDNDVQISEVVRNPGVYAEHMFSRSHWLKLLRGQVNVLRIVKVFWGRAWLALESRLRELCRALRIRTPDDLGFDLQSVAARGIRIVFFFARGDAGLPLLHVQAGSVLQRLGEGFRIHILEGADHIFTQRAPRMELQRLLSRELPGPLAQAESVP